LCIDFLIFTTNWEAKVQGGGGPELVENDKSLEMEAV
jgi:hypothetical protein